MLKMRIAIEQFLATQLIRTVLSHPGTKDHPGNFSITVNDGEDDVVLNSRDEAEILKSMFSTDEDYLYVFDGEGKQVGWVYLVYGNSGDDVFSDYSTSLDFIMDSVMETANLLSDGGFTISVHLDKANAWNKERV